MGDSAGGNYSTVLCNWIIENNLKSIDKLILSYPALSFSISQYTKSMKYAFTDFMLNYPFLVVCINCYVDEKDIKEFDYYLSPIHTPDHLLKKYPKSIVCICDFDVLRDDSMRFYLKINKNNNKSNKGTDSSKNLDVLPCVMFWKHKVPC